MKLANTSLIQKLLEGGSSQIDQLQLRFNFIFFFDLQRIRFYPERLEFVKIEFLSYIVLANIKAVLCLIIQEDRLFTTQQCDLSKELSVYENGKKASPWRSEV